MKILYAIQGTGNGHISRARDIIPLLKQFGEVSILLSGVQVDVALPYKINYRYKGLSFIFGKNGGIDLYSTIRKGDIKQLLKDIKSLPVQEYDIVINDFEPVSAWACYYHKIPCIGLSHQWAVLNAGSPKPKKSDLIGRWVLKNYAPVTAAYGFHFQAYAENIFTPVIRQQIRTATLHSRPYYTVYLPAYSDETLIKKLRRFRDFSFQVFSKKAKKAYIEKNVTVIPIHNEGFVISMASGTGVLCGAGFETPAEVLHLGKKLLVVPMKGQFEQLCNAAALKKMGVPVVKNLKKKNLENVLHWLEDAQAISVQFPDITAAILEQILKNETRSKVYELPELSGGIFNLGSLLKS